MASKQYKGKTCVYCGVPGISSTGDHVIAREFFPENERSSIPKVPACLDCNNAKSKLEQYLSTVLPLGSGHPIAESMMADKFIRRMEKNRRLQREVHQSSKYILELNKWGTYELRLAVAFNWRIASEYFSMVARGLYFHHQLEVIPADCQSRARFTRHLSLPHVERAIFPESGRICVDGTIARGAFTYKGTFSNNGKVSAWTMEFYGGIELRSERTSGKTSSGWKILAITAPLSLFEQLERRQQTTQPGQDGLSVLAMKSSVEQK